MPKKTNNKAILRENRFLIIQRLMQHKTIREIATEIGVSYYPLYDYLATGKILHDE
jgi:molybdenum-dependent DNA-binding transcriptional regulator ModE